MAALRTHGRDPGARAGRRSKPARALRSGPLEATDRLTRQGRRRPTRDGQPAVAPRERGPGVPGVRLGGSGTGLSSTEAAPSPAMAVEVPSDVVAVICGHGLGSRRAPGVTDASSDVGQDQAVRCVSASRRIIARTVGSGCGAWAAYRSQKRLDELRVELRAGVAAELGDRLRRGTSRACTAGRGSSRRRRRRWRRSARRAGSRWRAGRTGSRGRRSARGGGG